MKRYLTIAVVIGLFQLCAFWLASSFASLDGHFPSPQPDTKLYCQVARRIVEGHPFSYSEGEALSTGTTSVLYPFVLAIPYACGAAGDKLLVAGFFLNGAFYLLFLLGWMAAAARWVRGTKTRLLIAVLLGLATQPAVCAFGQTDTGLWMAVSALFAAAVAWKQDGWALLLLLLGPWVRPEGVILVLAYGLSTAICSPTSRRRWVMVGLGVVSSVFVFVFNWWLTGRFQFDSVAHKGYFKMQPLADAVILTLRDGMEILRTFFVGTTATWPQSIYFIPVVGGALLLAGIVFHRWHRTRSFPAAVMGWGTLGALAVVASSSWLGSNFDRYLAWTMPVFLVFMAEGAVSVGNLAVLSRMRNFPCWVCVAFHLIVAAGGVAMLHSSSVVNVQTDEYQRACERAMAESDRVLARAHPASVGGVSCSDAYEYSARRFRHLYGIYSPEFLDYYHVPWAMELLKRRRDLRFDYWDLTGQEVLCSAEQTDDVYGQQCVSGPNGRALRMADWRTFDAGETMPQVPVGLRLVARLDVGYLVEERAAEYEVVDRWGRKPAESFFAVAPLNGCLAVDGARSIQGGDMFTVPLESGRDCLVSMRVLPRHGNVVLSSPVRMLLQVDGVDVGAVQYPLDVKTNAFQEVSFKIPGGAIANTPCRIGLLGDHIVSGYWFWQ